LVYDIAAANIGAQLIVISGSEAILKPNIVQAAIDAATSEVVA